MSDWLCRQNEFSIIGLIWWHLAADPPETQNMAMRLIRITYLHRCRGCRLVNGNMSSDKRRSLRLMMAWNQAKVRLRRGRTVSVHHQWTVHSEWRGVQTGLWSGCDSPGRFEGWSRGGHMQVMPFLFRFVCVPLFKNSSWTQTKNRMVNKLERNQKVVINVKRLSLLYTINCCLRHY